MSTLTLRAEPPERLDLKAITPEVLGGLSQADASRLPVGTSRLGLVLADAFAIKLDGSESLIFEGGSPRLDGVGMALSQGHIRVEGDVGQRLGEGMSSGSVTVTGSAGPFAGTGATGGTITIDGNAGDHAGGAVFGAMAGLNGATLIIRGMAGDNLGDRMRRGFILARHAGARAGSRMIAGTIVASTIGDEPGYGMRRGTIVTERHGALLPTFAQTGTPDLVFLRLLSSALRRLGCEQADLLEGRMARYSGDLATIGKGELFAPVV